MLTKVKSLLNMESVTDANVIARLQNIIDITSARLKVLAGTKTVPVRLEHIVVEVSVKRFNRLGSEGLASHTVEGETMDWGNNDDDFAEFMDEIDLFCTRQGKPLNVVRFL